MPLTVHPQTEQRIQREVELGRYRGPDDVINRALSLLDQEEEWLQRNREVINRKLETSFAQAERGELYTPEEARRILAERRVQRGG